MSCDDGGRCRSRDGSCGVEGHFRRAVVGVTGVGDGGGGLGLGDVGAAAKRDDAELPAPRPYQRRACTRRDSASTCSPLVGKPWLHCDAVSRTTKH